MAEFFKGTVLVSPIVISSSGNTYPTHHSIFGSGGYREVNTIIERDRIPVDGLFPTINYDGISSGQRRLGMLVHVFDDDTIYQLHPKISEDFIAYETWTGYTNTEKYLALSANTSWYPLFSDTTDGIGYGSNISKIYTQVTHGFVVGDVIGYNGTEFTKVSSVTAATVEPLGVVSKSDFSLSGGTNTTFTLTYAGYANTTGFVDYSGGTLISGRTYYLAGAGYSGKLTLLKPTGLTEVSKPMLVKTAVKNAIVLQYRGISRSEEGITLGEFYGYTGDTQLFLDKTVTGATNIGYFSGFTGIQILDILTSDPLFNGNYVAEYNNYYRDINGVIQLGTPTYHGILRRGYVSSFSPTKSWLYNTYTGSSNQVGWILVNGDISENVGNFLTANPNSGTPVFTETEWSYVGGDLSDGYYSNSAISLDVSGDLYTGSTYSIGGPVYRDKEYKELRMRTILSESPDTIIVTYDDNFIYVSGRTSGSTYITGVTSASNIGTGYGVYDSLVGDQLQFRSLIPSGYTEISYSGDSIIITSSSPSNTITGATNVGSGVGIYESTESFHLNLRSFVGSGDTIVQNSGYTNIIYTPITTISGATNGLTKFGRNVGLGGTLTGNTDIYLSNFNFAFLNDSQGFTIGTGFSGEVNDIKYFSDDKMLVVGEFTTFTGTTYNRIIKLNTDGSVDSTFITGSGFDWDVNTIGFQTDDKIIITGAFTSYSGASHNRIVRLNTDGTVDATYNNGTGFNSTVWTHKLQTDNKILAGGAFATYSGASYARLIRLNTDGTIDTTFTIGTGFNGNVNAINVQTDNKILVGGSFTVYSGVTCNGLIRLNSDGSIDSTFSIVTTESKTIYSIEIQTDNKILAGGAFAAYSGVSKNYLVRLNTDGTIDNTFDIGSGFSNTLTDIHIQQDNQILIGGYYSTYSGVSKNYLVRLNTDGTIDNTFDIGSGFSGGGVTVTNIINTNSTGKITVGGVFTSYNGTTANYMVQLNADGSIDTVTAGSSILFNSSGATYGDNYHSRYTLRSLPDVDYVTGLTSQIANNNIYPSQIITGTTTLTTGSSFVILVNHIVPITINLPLIPLSNQVFKIKDASGNALVNNVIVSGNTKNIDGDSIGTINTNYGSFELLYNSILDEWYSLSVI